MVSVELGMRGRCEKGDCRHNRVVESQSELPVSFILFGERRMVARSHVRRDLGQDREGLRSTRG
jgi:hypothetical protein